MALKHYDVRAYAKKKSKLEWHTHRWTQSIKVSEASWADVAMNAVTCSHADSSALTLSGYLFLGSFNVASRPWKNNTYWTSISFNYTLDTTYLFNTRNHCNNAINRQLSFSRSKSHLPYSITTVMPVHDMSISTLVTYTFMPCETGNTFHSLTAKWSETSSNQFFPCVCVCTNAHIVRLSGNCAGAQGHAHCMDCCISHLANCGNVRPGLHHAVKVIGLSAVSALYLRINLCGYNAGPTTLLILSVLKTPTFTSWSGTLWKNV